MQYGNIITQQIIPQLPSILVTNGQTITGAGIQHWAALGWREVVQVDSPPPGFRVGTYNVVELTGLTCKLAVGTSINIADEAAALEAARQAALAAQAVVDKDGGKVLMDSGTNSIERALRAFAALALQEINTLRTKAGLATYTPAQFISALKAKIDEQS